MGSCRLLRGVINGNDVLSDVVCAVAAVVLNEYFVIMDRGLLDVRFVDVLLVAVEVELLEGLRYAQVLLLHLLVAVELGFWRDVLDDELRLLVADNLEERAGVAGDFSWQKDLVVVCRGDFILHR